MRRLSRRGFARLSLNLVTLWAAGAEARAAGDRGFGGIGAAPVDPDETLGQDRGIGGTGVVGTIRRFGSVVVNDLRVSYPDGVPVTIDGARASAADLRIGQVVRVFARPRGAGLETQAIAVTNEVVGPVEAIDDAGFVVLGQSVLAEPEVRGRLRPGRVVAVAGLRRPDGVIVATFIAPKAARTPIRLAGPVVADSEGSLRIGGLDIVGLTPSLVGRRVVLTGRRIDGGFQASSVTIEGDVPFSGADRLSIEGYVARAGETLQLGSGLTLPAGRVGSELNEGEVVRAVVVATPDERGTLVASEIHIERGPRQRGRGPGRRGSAAIGRSDAAFAQKGSSRGFGAGPGSSSRGGASGGGRGGGSGGSGGGGAGGGN